MGRLMPFEVPPVLVLLARRCWSWVVGPVCWQRLERVQTHTVTIYTEDKKNRTMAPSWTWNRSTGEVGTALRSIFKMLRKAVPNPPGD